MKLKVFYYSQLSDKEIESSCPMPLDHNRAADLAKEILQKPGDFIGFVDELQVTLQFYVEESGKIWVEFPTGSGLFPIGSGLLQ